MPTENRLSVKPIVRGAAIVGCLLGLALTVSPQAQTQPTVQLPKPDAQGWISIFRGDNKGDFAVYTTNGAPSAESKPFGDPFIVQSGDTLRTTGEPGGHLTFK